MLNLEKKILTNLVFDCNTYWHFGDDGCSAMYFTWIYDDRIGYMSEHYFDYSMLKERLDQDDWKDVHRFNEKTFGDAYHFSTYLDDIYLKDEERLYEWAKSVQTAIFTGECKLLSDHEAMIILKDRLGC